MWGIVPLVRGCVKWGRVGGQTEVAGKGNGRRGGRVVVGGGRWWGEMGRRLPPPCQGGELCRARIPMVETMGFVPGPLQGPREPGGKRQEARGRMEERSVQIDEVGEEGLGLAWGRGRGKAPAVPRKSDHAELRLRL